MSKQKHNLLSAWIGNEPPVPLVIGVYPADQVLGWLNEELGVVMGLQLCLANEEAIAAIAVICGLRRVAVAEDCLYCD